MKLLKGVLAVLAVFVCRVVPAQMVAPFRSGDRVMFVGNSITEAGYYHSYLWLYYMTRFPDRRIRIYNRGIGGDVVGQMYDRLDVEVLPEKPTVIVLTFGMNDSGYFEYYGQKKDSVADARVATSLRDFKKAEQKLLRYPQLRTILLSTAAYDSTTTSTKNNQFPGKFSAIGRIAAFQKAAALKNGWGFVDLNGEMTEINRREQAKDRAFSLSPGDRIHPENGGHLVMTYLLLKAQGLTGRPVAAVSVNAATGRLEKAENCQVSQLSAGPGFVRFRYLAGALPFPVDTLPRMWGSKGRQSDALAVVPFTQECNQEVLRVAQLAPGRYELRIDDQLIGQWTEADFARGINLAEQMHTPQYQQAILVRELNQERMDIEKRFRQYNWVEFDVLKDKGLLRTHSMAALDTVRSQLDNGFVRGNAENWTKARYAAIREVWTDQMNLLVDKIYAVNRPVARRISIQKLP